MTFHIVGYKIKWNGNVIKVCGGFIEAVLFLWYYCIIKRCPVVVEEYFVHEDKLP